MANGNQERQPVTRGTVGERSQPSRRSFSAQGPQDIPTQLQQTAPQDAPSGLSDALEIGAQVGSKMYVQHQRRELESSVEDLKKIGIADASDFTEEEMNAVFQGKQVFDRYKRAKRQGAMTDEAAQIAIESEVNRLSNQFPALKSEITQMATNTLGFNPQGSEFSFMTANQEEEELTTFEKGMRDAEQAAGELGVDARAARQMYARNHIAGLRVEEAENEKALGIGDGSSLQSEYYNKSVLAAEEFNSMASEFISETGQGSGFTPESRANLKQRLEQEKNLLMSEFTADAEEADLSASEMRAARTDFGKVFEAQEELLDDNAFWENVQSTVSGRETLQKAVVNNQLPMLNMMSKISDRPLDLYNKLVSSGDKRMEAFRQAMIDSNPAYEDMALTNQDKLGTMASTLRDIGMGNYVSKNTGRSRPTSPAANAPESDAPEPVKDNLTITHAAMGDDLDFMDASKNGSPNTAGENLIAQMGDTGITSRAMRNIADNPSRFLEASANRNAVQAVMDNAPAVVFQAVQNAVPQESDNLDNVEFSVNPETGQFSIRTQGSDRLRSETRPLGSEGPVLPEQASRMGMESVNAVAEVLDSRAGQRHFNMSKQDFANKVQKSLDTVLEQRRAGASEEAIRNTLRQSESFVKEDFVRAATKYATDQGLDPNFVTNVVKQESNWKPDAVNKSSGAAGLMQLMPETAREMQLQVEEGNDERLDPEANLEAGINYLSWLKQRPYIDGDKMLMAAAYNWGPGHVRAMVEAGSTTFDYNGERVKLPKETKDYVQTVTGNSLVEHLQRRRIINTRQ